MPDTAQQEVRELFDRWFRASSALDIEGAMAPIAADVVSYEHTDRLQHVGVDAVRGVCQQGFDAVVGEFCWDVPDLDIVVRDDLAVAWGLNRMRFRPPGGDEAVTWSRGTRVLRRVDREWRMVHQQLSYPIDPTTGRALTDLAP